MRLPFRRRAADPHNLVPNPSHGAVERRAPASVLTRWLRQGLEAGMCPLCRVAHKADREYIWHFFDEGDRRGESIDQLRESCGFCAEHIEMLRRIEVDGMKSTLGVSTMFARLFAGIVEDLEALNAQRSFRRAVCPACASRTCQLQKNAAYLLDELATSPGRRADFENSQGLCFAHFELVWEAAQTSEERALLLQVQRRAARALLADLREHVRKHDHKYAHEPKGAEQDSWQRAIFMTAGWTPPAASAAEPERHE